MPGAAAYRIGELQRATIWFERSPANAETQRSANSQKGVTSAFPNWASPSTATGRLRVVGGPGTTIRTAQALPYTNLLTTEHAIRIYQKDDVFRI